jgi:hypothetical protein
MRFPTVTNLRCTSEHDGPLEADTGYASARDGTTLLSCNSSYRHGFSQSEIVHDAQSRHGRPGDDARRSLTDECFHERQSGEVRRHCLGTAPWEPRSRRMSTAGSLESPLPVGTPLRDSTLASEGRRAPLARCVQVASLARPCRAGLPIKTLLGKADPRSAQRLELSCVVPSAARATSASTSELDTLVARTRRGIHILHHVSSKLVVRQLPLTLAEA